MISFDTTRFGRLEVDSEKVIHFPHGLIGFRDIKRFILMDYKDTFLKWLQAVDDRDIAFIVVPAFEFFPDYVVKLDIQTKKLLKMKRDEDIVVFLMLRVDGEEVTANLQGPLILNSISMKGIQAVNEDTRFSCKTPLKSLIII